MHRDWAPNGADRFYNLVKIGFYDDTRFFRAVDGFMVQFGISGDPRSTRAWREANIPDDPVKQSNKRGFVTFATREAQYAHHAGLHQLVRQRAPRRDGASRRSGRSSREWTSSTTLYKGYGEGAPMGAGPDQGRIQAQGNAYLDKAQFPKLDYTQKAAIEPAHQPDAGSSFVGVRLPTFRVAKLMLPKPAAAHVNMMRLMMRNSTALSA